tara:strand:+ start:173 stop:1882 length:1710 start_codon:yes stop_codon:yes gene_type:complete
MADPGDNINNLGQGAEEIKGAFNEIKGVLLQISSILEAQSISTKDYAANLAEAKAQREEDEKKAKLVEEAQKKINAELEKANKKKEVMNKLLSVANGAAAAFTTAIMAADKETTQMGRGLNLSKKEAIGVKDQFAKIASNSGDVAINSVRLSKANAGLNAQLGTGVQFSGDMLTTFSKLTEIVGITGEAAGNLAFQGQMAGQSFREVEENVLGASYEMQRGVGIQLDMKGVLEATGKVTGMLRANLGANPEAIAKAVTQAKLLGTELETLSAAGATLLDFESSIEKELEAELLTGKQLNLEKARAAALAGDELALGEELSKNFGTHSDFMEMNVIQRQKLAAAVGMEAGAMADMLFKQETMGMNAKQLRAQGKDELANKLEQLDTQEKLALAQEKFKTIMGDVATAVLPIVERFGQVVAFLAESKGITGALIGITVALAAAAKTMAAIQMITAVAKIFGESAKAGPIVGTIAALAGVAALVGAVAMTQGKVKDGFAPSSKGPFTITDNYGGMAKTTPGDNLQVGPKTGASASPQPIVVQNNWDAFSASNGNGRKGLGGTQSLQASPTFA